MGLLNRLRRTPELLRDYNDIIQEQIEKGIAIAVDVPLTTDTSTHLPHHAIIRSDKDTTKLHIVYNASAKHEGNPSLNYCLVVGPKLY